ncbi:Adenosine deaminase [Marinomonas spartinae]|uniref:hypothetical protein n=1 Tax=Marinomonas spartinae TaxID=1792290 RepID=UPI000808DD6F|nr:hypothetical protein [Marinomonas spartinae]SBS31567.1 Adenosine deaminase [Marinomonas spartinae]
MFINTYLLSSPRLYAFLLNQVSDIFIGKTSFDEKGSLLNSIKEIAYDSWHKSNSQHIDQIFHRHWDNLIERKKSEASFSRVLLGQASRYHLDDDTRRLAIKLERFSEWQSWISCQSGLPVIAFKIACIPSFPDNKYRRLQWLKGQLGYRSIISPYSPLVEDYIDVCGLNETHIHLNGVTSIENMWDFALNHPELVATDLNEKYSKPRVKLLYATMPEFDSPEKFEGMLYLAGALRRLLFAWLRSCDKTRVSANLTEYIDAINSYLKGRVIGSSQIGSSFCDDVTEKKEIWSHLYEIDLHVSVLKELELHPSPVIDACYLLYVLSLNVFQRIMVQRADQVGFDQFQKFADDGVREEYEKSYRGRFFQLHGPNPNGRSDLLTLEGRFAPKSTEKKNQDLLESILRGYLEYAGKSQDMILHSSDLGELALEVQKFKRPMLILVAHFIKQVWNKGQESHFYSLRDSLRKSSHLLFDLLESFPTLRNIITGIDAAANELEAPPEVFAELYRNCKRNGFTHFTYHVGEDFEHLLSGIRAVYEAVIFLDLKNGDRIGHATSIGLDPSVWVKKMPEKLYLPRGQWLENMLFLREIALFDGHHYEWSLAHIESEITKLAINIFDESIDINSLQAFFRSRSLCPDIVAENTQNGIELVGWLDEERKLYKHVDKKVRQLLSKRWSDGKTINKYEESIEISVAFTPVKMLLQAQQFTQREVARRHVVIESLPTSNVRISHYDRMEEHHLFRWLQVPERELEGDHKMVISLGSDDPGIFATDLRNEFYHLFACLVINYNYSESQALDMLSKLNENGRIYRFDNKIQMIDEDKISMAETWD